MRHRPKINIELDPIDKAMEMIGIIGLLILIVLPIYFFDKLPDTIPIHYGAKGKPDGYGGKAMIWTLPLIGIVMYFGMRWLNKFPHTFNYPQKITEDNAIRLYTFATKMMRTLNVIITCVFALITYSTVQTALGNQFGLGTLFTPIFMLLIFGTIGYFLFKSLEKAE